LPHYGVFNNEIIKENCKYNIKLTNLSTSSAAHDHTRRKSIARREMCERSSMKLYSTMSKRNHITVAPARIPPDKFRFLHSSISATAKLMEVANHKDINRKREKMVSP
jgi:hypothetical protein